MKAEVTDQGILIVSATNKIESYALHQWCINNINGCTGQLIEPTYFFIKSEVPKLRFHKRLWLRFLLFLYR